jgi:hypothetical protein
MGALSHNDVWRQAVSSGRYRRGTQPLALSTCEEELTKGKKQRLECIDCTEPRGQGGGFGKPLQTVCESDTNADTCLLRLVTC